MEKNLFRKLSWPKNTHMDLLAQIIPENLLIRLLGSFKNRSEEERIVRFPKSETILKCLAYYYGQKVESGVVSWKGIMKNLKGDYSTLKQLRKETKLRISQKEIKKLFAQRKREIEDGR